MAGPFQLLTGVRKRVSSQLKRCFPRHWRLPFDYASDKYGCALEPELLNLAKLFADSPRARAIDVGANVGFYSYRLACLFEKVEAFEPQAELVDSLRDYANSYQPNIRIHALGLSETSGQMTLRIPMTQHHARSRLVFSWATLNSISVPHKPVEVSVRCLDDFGFDDVSFMKIDVEGHELEVLRGARETLARCRPILLVEIEQRHHPEVSVSAIISEVCEMGYTPAVFRPTGVHRFTPGNGLPTPTPLNYLFFPR